MDSAVQLDDESIPATNAPPKRTRPTPSKTFQCRGHGDCRMVFSRSEHLARHIRKHTGERPFSCHCGKQFSRLDNLRQHAQTVHADKPEMNERMMRELGRVHATMVAANKQAATGSSGRSRGSQDSTAAGGSATSGGGRNPGRSKVRPGTSTGYEGAGGGEDMYPGLSMAPNHQLSLTGFSDLPDPYLIPKKEKSNDDLAHLAALDGENGNSNGSYSRSENTSNGWYHRFHPHSHHSYNTYNTYDSSLNSNSTSYPVRSSSTHSPSLSSSSSPSPVHELESSYNGNGVGPTNFPYEHLPHLPFNTASASAPYLPLSTSPVTDIPPMPLGTSGNVIQQQQQHQLLHQRRSSSRTSHSHPSLHIHPHAQMHSPPIHARSPYHSPPLSASHSGGSSSASGGYFPLSPADSNSSDIRHQHQSHRQHHGSTSLPGTPFEGGPPPYSNSQGYPSQRAPSRGPGPDGGYTTSAAWVSQGPGVPGGGVGVGYWG